jgi:uncharacterized protein (TIGR03437 family)
MDAAKLSFSRTGLLFSLALLIPASAFSQTAFSPSLTSITLVGLTPQTDTISSTTSTAITFNAKTTYLNGDPPWLTIDASATTDQVTGLVTAANLYVRVGQQANGSNFLPGLHTANITLHDPTGASGAADVVIPVSYNTGSNGGTTAGVLSASPNSPSASVAYLGSTVLFFNLVSSSTTPVSFTLQAPAVSWASNFVTSGGFTSGTVVNGSPVQVQVTLNGSGQAQTTLSTTLSVAYGGNTLSIPLTFGNGVNAGGGGGGTGTIQFSPSSVSWTYTAGGSFPPQTGINVSSSTGAASFTATVSPANSWFTVVPANGALPNILTVEPTSNIASLATGAYTGVVTVFGSDNSQQSFNVNLVVNGGTTNGLTVSPNPISLQTALNGSSVSQSVTVTSTTGGSLSASVSGAGLTYSVSASNIQANVATTAITVTGNPATLGNGSYVGSLTVTVGGVSQAVQVNFVVGTGSGGGGGSTGTISAAPSAVNFVYQNNSGMQVNQQQQVYLAGSGNYTAAVTNSSGGSWLSVSSTSGTLPSQFFQIITNASNLASGTYTGAVTFTNTSTNQTAVVSVNLLVTGTTAVYANPGDLVFSYIAGTTSATQFQNVSLLASDNSAVSVTAAISNPSNSPWLSITPNGSSLTGQAAYAVTVNASNIANGLYTGYITVTAATGNSPITVPVVLNVVGSSSGGGGGGLTLGTSSLTFQAALGGFATTQQLSVSATNATSFTATASTNSGNNTWLSVSPAGSSVTNTTLTITANPAGLVAGTYSGQITLISGSGTQTVPVTMIVGGGGGAGGNITVTANGGTSTSPSLTFTAQSVGGSVASQYLTVTSASGSSPVSFIAVLSGSSCGWVNLGIVPSQAYQTPLNNLNIGATTTGLASGTYNCTLTLTPTGGTAVTVPLALTVVGTPTISLSVTTLTFSYAAGTAAPSAQTVTVTGAGSSASTFTASATSNPAGWLSVSPASGTASPSASAPLTVSVNPSGLAVGTYTGSVSVVPGTGSTGGGTVTVTLTVTAPIPVITTVLNGASFLGGALSPGEFVTIMGTSLGPLTPLQTQLDSTGKVATTLGNVQVFFSATPAPLTYVSSTQINCIVPYGVSGLSTVPIQVKFLAQPSNVVTQNVQNSAPGIFTATGTGTGQGSILNQNFIPNSVATPAAKGSIIQIYMTGEGNTNPPGTDGAITANATTFPVLPVAVTIGGQPATVVFKGEAPGIVAGVLQLNVTIPPTVTSGPNQVSVTIGSNTSQANLTVAVQ